MALISLKDGVFLLAAGLSLAGVANGVETTPSYLTTELAASSSSAKVPVRLPPIEVLILESAAVSTPFLLTPVANLNLDEFQTAPAVKLGVGQPMGEKPSIGGWISFGASGYIAQ